MKEIPGLPGYFATEGGRIRTPTGLWAAQSDNGNGYLYFSVQRRFAPRRRAVHWAVCSAYHGSKSSPELEVRHLNGIKSDNRFDNLAWGTRVDNRRDSRQFGHPPARGKLTREDVEEIRRLASLSPRTAREKSIGHVSYADIARRFGVTPTHVAHISLGRYGGWVESP